ncbi:MAG: EscC/YscC/HrcC family type III secretion system outer membrane ring protein, partial [Burkholderiaceae bacterium]|nr:EscC/YscC/HrcC family type III secretion system outer membrane ring protein [Burkholderiaceae bacterium]
LDLPTALVEIEAMIIDVSTDRASELGVNWSGRIGKVANFSVGQTSTAAAAAKFGLSLGSLNAGSYLLSQLSALETKGDAEVQARPSVLTSDNLPALLDLSETFYIRSQGERVASVTPVTAGTTLRVTPHVLQQDGRVFVRLKIDIEDGRITDQQIDSLPTVSRGTVSTEATLPQGEVLLIAGYKSSQNFQSRQQVPVLGEVPIVDLIFSNKARSTQKRERMFLIRPKVVGLPEQLPAATAAVIPPIGNLRDTAVQLSLTPLLSIVKPQPKEKP